MAIKQYNPKTPSQRFLQLNKSEVSKKEPESRLVKSVHRSKGRNCYGRITSRRRGGGHKRLYREIDFRRDKYELPAKVTAIEYDPNRSANLALLVYVDGEKRYILAPRGLNVGDTVISTNNPVEDYTPGIALPLKLIPPATDIHAIEMNAGRGAQIARGAGTAAILVAVEGKMATVKMPSGEIRLLNANCRATVGEVGNSEHSSQSLGKAGRNRWLGRRPRVRGIAMNPVDHPQGGRTNGGAHPVSPWGQLAKGLPTRTRSKPSNSMILVRRNGRKVRR
ncbi:MAG: 50S ribosomal protein L2 [Verrucomicrobia bacterium GWF2_51_19]|nr:MAG: 50S ribosomal protein L2 [Verrucomicrobia bacterium GWF2_51_19]HCJ12574.1 50S ribosomal protein L2 [Opitutae bacterium]